MSCREKQIILLMLRIFSDRNGNPPSIAIEGNAKNVQNAKEHIQNFLQNSSNRNAPRSNEYSTSNTQKISKNVEIEPSNVGLVIGRGGSTIREITSTFNVKVDIGMF